MAEQILRDALKELRTYCGRYVDDPKASEDEQVAYDDVCIRLAQILRDHPAGDGGLREALERIARGDVPLHTPAAHFARDALAAHPAAPAVPQPVDREALAEAWDEGHRAGWEHHQDGNYGNDFWDDTTPNPYRSECICHITDRDERIWNRSCARHPHA